MDYYACTIINVTYSSQLLNVLYAVVRLIALRNFQLSSNVVSSVDMLLKIVEGYKYLNIIWM